MNLPDGTLVARKIRERLHESDEISLILIREAKMSEFSFVEVLRDLRFWPAAQPLSGGDIGKPILATRLDIATVVEVDHLLKAAEIAVVHVRADKLRIRLARHVPKGWYFELANV